MKKWRLASLLLSGLLFVAISIYPTFLMLREYIIDNNIKSQYSIQHADTREGNPVILDKSNITVNGHLINIIERPTGKTVRQGEVKELELQIDGKSYSSEIWDDNVDHGSKYFSWLDILTITNRENSESRVAIVERIPAKQEGNWQWRIIYVDSEGKQNEEHISYSNRSLDKLGVKLINYSGTSLSALGYYSDILYYYPSLIFPILYPWGTLVLGTLLMLAGFIFIRREI